MKLKGKQIYHSIPWNWIFNKKLSQFIYIVLCTVYKANTHAHTFAHTKYIVKINDVFFWKVLKHFMEMMQVKIAKVKRKEKKWPRERGRFSCRICFQFNSYLQMVINVWYIYCYICIAYAYFIWLDIVIKLDFILKRIILVDEMQRYLCFIFKFMSPQKNCVQIKEITEKLKFFFSSNQSGNFHIGYFESHQTMCSVHYSYVENKGNKIISVLIKYACLSIDQILRIEIIHIVVNYFYWHFLCVLNFHDRNPAIRTEMTHCWSI